jgi:hypothetical protein
MSELKIEIEHASDAVQAKCYVITGTDKQQSICWEGDADYEAIGQLRQRIAELEAAGKILSSYCIDANPPAFMTECICCDQIRRHGCEIKHKPDCPTLVFKQPDTGDSNDL